MDLLHELERAAPPGRPAPDARAVERLRALTAALLDARPGALDEYCRFTAIRHRTITPPAPAVAAEVTGRTIVVTGGSGCVGRALLEELVALRPGRLISLADAAPRAPVPGVDYVHGDVRDAPTLHRLFGDRRPHVVFHLAAQRDPGRA